MDGSIRESSRPTPKLRSEDSDSEQKSIFSSPPAKYKSSEKHFEDKSMEIKSIREDTDINYANNIDARSNRNAHELHCGRGSSPLRVRRSSEKPKSCIKRSRSKKEMNVSFKSISHRDDPDDSSHYIQPLRQS